MELKVLPYALSVCKVSSPAALDPQGEFWFAARTDEEISLVCPTAAVPAGTTHREDGWRGFRIQGTLDFSLVGILSRISTLLADAGIGLFAVSTYNTDYILVKAEALGRALAVLRAAGYTVEE